MNRSRIAYDNSIVALGRAIGKQLWSGNVLINPGFFANTIGGLTKLCAEFSDENTHRLLAGVWWCGNAYLIPRLPPSGEGVRCLI